MKQKKQFVSFFLTFLLGMGIFVIYSFSKEALTPKSQEVEPPMMVLQGASSPTPPSASVPPPPPRGIEETVASEPQRRLVGITDEELQRIEKSLPPGSHVYVSPVGNDESMAALAVADLNGDGRVETIVVHTTGGTTTKNPAAQLQLSVLAETGGGFSKTTSVPIGQGVLFNIALDGSSVPLVLRDLTGDRVPEIVVASGIGASLGGALHIFRGEGSSLVNVLKIEGNIFRVTQSGVVTAQSRYEDKAKLYRWNGHRFVLLG